MAFILFIFFVAAIISGVAAYFSLVGLGSIFAATFWGVVIMGAALEVGKIVTAKWIHTNWRNPSAPWYFRGLLCFFVACLMAITSLGIYGYLSKGHLEQQAPLAGLGIQVAQLETQLKQKQDENVRLEARLGQISKITDKVLEGNARAGLRASNQSKKEAAEIQKSIDANNTVINDITQKLVPLKIKTGNVEGELGVAKFIAEALGMDGEKAIRIIISLIMAAFDPLAISMFIMGSISLQKLREEKAKATKVEAVIPPVEMVPVSDLLDHPIEAVEEEAETFEEKLEEKLEDLIEQDTKYDELKNDLAEARAAFDKERQEFAQEYASVSASIQSDQQSLSKAHQELLDMEARLNDERELLQQWEAQLTQQQNAINAWKPESNTPSFEDDPRTPKELIIELLELNPDIVNDIVQVVESMRQNRPGL
jgi:hypothetical protein